MAKFHFFTNTNGLISQTQIQSYGPMPGNEDSEYRVTSIFSSSSNLKAYAICNGKVFAQEVNGKINIVLKPAEQPSNAIPVKYYIYKGIDKSFLIDSSTPTNIAAATKSDLTDIIQRSQIQRNIAYDKNIGNDPETTTTPATLSAIGLNLTAIASAPNNFLDSAFVDDVFLRIDWDEFPSVSGGEDLGQFVSNSFGFEIILDGLGKGPTLADVRNSEMIITVNPNPSGDVNKFKEATKRAEILNYIDPCAFYANFFFDGLYLKKNSTDTNFIKVNNKKEGNSNLNDAIYTEILSLFYTKDIIYLDIRNEHNHDLNYYRNYNILPNEFAKFYLSYDGGTSSLEEYQYLKFNPSPPYTPFGWPIFAIPASSFTNANTNIPSTITLKLPEGDNPAPSVYLVQGYYFSDFRKMSQYPKTNQAPRDGIFYQTNFTVEIKLSIPKLSNNTTIPFHINLRYLKRYPFKMPTPPIGILTIEAQHYIDNLFELTFLLKNDGSLKIPLQNNDLIKWSVTNAIAYVDETSEYGSSYIAKIGIGEDVSNIYFFALQKNENIITDSNNDTQQLPNILSKKYNYNTEFNRLDFIDSNNNPQAIIVSNALPDAVHDLLVNPTPLDKDGRSLIFVAIDKGELPTLVSAMNTLEAGYDKRLVLRNKQTKTDYTEFDLVVEGYKFNGTVAVQEEQTNIKIRNGSNFPRLFASPAAVQNFDGLDSIEENRKHLSNSRIAKGTIVNIRTSPNLPKSNQTSNLLVTTEGDEYYFTVIGKSLTTNDNKDDNPNYTDTIDRVWYYIELKSSIDIDDPLTHTSYKIPIGTKAWVAEGTTYLVASFEKFITDFFNLNNEIDIQETTIEGINNRITRLRQMTKESGIYSTLFDAIIDASPVPTPPNIIRLDQISYKSGESTVYNSVNVDTEIQLFKDYMGVRFGNEQIIDLHHLFIGLDVVNHFNPNRQISIATVLGWDTELFDPEATTLNNVDAATWAGDIGSIPGDFLVKDYNAPYPIPSFFNREETDSRFKQYWQANHPNATQLEQDNAYKLHYWETRAKEIDLISNVYPHLLHEHIIKYLSIDSNFKNLTAAIYYFNHTLINEGDKNAFQVFFNYLGLDISTSFTTQTGILNNIEDAIYKFSVLWYYNKFHAPVINDDALLHSLSNQLAIVFLKWLEKNKW